MPALPLSACHHHFLASLLWATSFQLQGWQKGPSANSDDTLQPKFRIAAEAAGRIATVHLRWRDPDTAEVMELSKGLYTDELAERFTDADPHFQCAVVVAEYADVLRGSYWAEDSTLAGVLEEAERVAELVSEDADMAEFVEFGAAGGAHCREAVRKGPMPVTPSQPAWGDALCQP